MGLIMNKGSSEPSVSDTQDQASESRLDPISQNIESIVDFYNREEQKVSAFQRVLEKISHIVGQPLFFISILLFVSFWILINLLLREYGGDDFDPPPFHFLQGILGLGSLLAATVIVIKQNRMAKLEEQRAHLDLQVNLLTEQKTSKLICLIEELRRDLPIVKDRYDPVSAALQESADPHRVLSELNEHREGEEFSQSVEKTRANIHKL